MPTYALALVLIAGLIHASWNIAAKKARGDVRFATFTGLVMMVFWAPLGLWLGWQQVPLWGLVPWAFILASAVLHLVYYLVLLRGYRKADLTVVYPMARGSGPLLSSMVAIVFLGHGANRVQQGLDLAPLDRVLLMIEDFGEGAAVMVAESVVGHEVPFDLVVG